MDVNLIQEQLSGAALQAFRTIIGKTKSNYDLSFSSFSTLFHSCVEPILDYGNSAWNIGNKCDKIDAVQFRALRFYLGVPKTTSLLYLTGEAGWIPGIVRRDLNVIRVYNDLVQMPRSRLARQIYEHDHSDTVNGAWSWNARTICESIGKLDNWLEQRTISIKLASKLLLESYEQEWAKEVVTPPKLDHYCEVKTELSCAEHLLAILPKKERALISRIRSGTLSLMIESGHYAGIKRHDRLCMMCKCEVENATHFLFKCDMLASERNNVLKDHPDIHKLNSVMEQYCWVTKKPHLFGRLIRKLWDARSNYVKQSPIF